MRLIKMRLNTALQEKRGDRIVSPLVLPRVDYNSYKSGRHAGATIFIRTRWFVS
jgi:hypothetical protein